jgi:uncharacterized protein YjbI with pentapeptide repeats
VAGALHGWEAVVVQVVGVVGGFLAALLGILKYFNYRSKRDIRAAVGESFASTVDRIASDNDTVRMTGAVLLRRFFDEKTEQGAAGTPYIKEAIEVIAGMLRAEQLPAIQKVLADGLHYANDLRGADLQNCNLQNAYIGRKAGEKRRVDLSGADLFESDCTRASFRDAIALNTVFYRATLEGTVLTGADCQDADFREAKLSGCKLSGAKIGGANFAGAKEIPGEVANLLDKDLVGRHGAEVPKSK